MNGRMFFGWAGRLSAAAVVATWLGCQAPATDRPVSAFPVATGAAAAIEQPVAVELRQLGHHLFVPVRLQGRDAGWFLFDTGAAIDAVGVGRAGWLGLPQVGRTTLIGIGGREPATLHRADAFSVGGVELGPATLAAIDLAPFSRATRQSVNGIVGFASLRNQPFTVDHQGSRLTIHPPGAEVSGGEPITLHRLAGLPVVMADLGNGRHVRLIIDTGMDAELTLPTGVLRRWPDVAAAPITATGRATGVGGTIESQRGWVRHIELMGVTLRDVPATFETPPHGLDVDPPVGRIGNRLLRDFILTFDAPRGIIHARWRPAD